MSYIGINGVSRLDPENKFDFNKAEQMAKEGYDPTVIKIQTGWEQGIDGFWRYEIPDPFMETSAIEDYVKPRFGEAINLRMILQDTRILAAYPEFESLTLYAITHPKKVRRAITTPPQTAWLLLWVSHLINSTFRLMASCSMRCSI